MGELRKTALPRQWGSRWLILGIGLILPFCVFYFTACRPSVETQLTSEQEQPRPAAQALGYRIQRFSAPQNDNYAVRLEELRQQFTPPQLQILEKLNRSDLDHLPRLENIVVPESWPENELVYSPLPPQYPWASQHAKALIVHQPSQAFGGYEYGSLVRWGPISSGEEKNLTPSGLYHLTWKDKGRRSTVDEDWYLPWYFNFENKSGLSFHQYKMPGYPASHACVRLLERDAQWLYQWGEQWELADDQESVLKTGTPVLIVGHYNFAAPPPWHSLAWLAQDVVLPADPPLDYIPALPTGPVGP